MLLASSAVHLGAGGVLQLDELDSVAGVRWRR